MDRLPFLFLGFDQIVFLLQKATLLLTNFFKNRSRFSSSLSLSLFLSLSLSVTSNLNDVVNSLKEHGVGYTKNTTYVAHGLVGGVVVLPHDLPSGLQRWGRGGCCIRLARRVHLVELNRGETRVYRENETHRAEN